MQDDSDGFCARFRSRLRLLAVRTSLLPDVTLPCHCDVTLSPGAPMFFWEQRYWLSSAGVANQIYFRQQERKRAIFERISDDATLEDTDLVVKGTCGKHLPVLCSTRGLLCWITERWFMDMHHCGPDKDSTMGWSRLLHQFASAAVGPATTLAKRDVRHSPTLTVEGITLTVGEGAIVNIRPLLRVWPSLPDEWDHQVKVRNTGLCPRPPNGGVKLGDLHRFLELRRRKTPGLDPGSAICILLHGVREVLMSLVEVAVHGDVQRMTRASTGRDARFTVLLGQGGRYTQHHCSGHRIELLKRVCLHDGSGETAARVLGFHHGSAAICRAMRNRCYASATIAEFQAWSAFAVGWDGSSHGGPEVLVGQCICLGTSMAAVMKPQACLFYLSRNSKLLR